MKINKIILFTITSAFSLLLNNENAFSHSLHEGLPLKSEKLSKSIKLNNCIGMEIVEWRPITNFPSTNPSLDGVYSIEKLCQISFNEYENFLNYKNFLFKKEKFLVNISLMPANTLLEGKNSRNLNDVGGRFRVIQPKCCSWGIYDSPTSFLFLRNDPIIINNNIISENKFFSRTFLHEMAHVFNDKWHVREKNFPGNMERDEEIAEEWVKFISNIYSYIPQNIDTSWEDLSNKNYHK